MRIAGIDPSLRRTGYCIMDGDGMKSGVITVGENAKDWRGDWKETERLMTIAREILETVTGDGRPDAIFMEGLAMGMSNSRGLMQLAGLNYLIRAKCMEKGIDFFVLTPSEVKKFATGAGNAKKDMMIEEVNRKFGLDISDDNEADAIAITYMGKVLLESELDLCEG